ncbi:hypothetical protein J1N35_034177 [Gossypium stocksii]|uniref:Uncharacterized protein n=1 Tax=Gossypium stocksii TaxID=47602 RepID=A0A9D3URI8_9ROSI|nr:hypothetical protein J1N35_034177 [Gossypium stocksii]
MWRHIIRQDNICLISDRSKGLLVTIRLAILMPKMGLRKAKKTEAGHVYVEAIQKAMAINSRREQKMNAELCSCNLETFRVQGYINRRSGLPPRSYAVDL